MDNATLQFPVRALGGVRHHAGRGLWRGQSKWRVEPVRAGRPGRPAHDHEPSDRLLELDLNTTPLVSVSTNTVAVAENGSATLNLTVQSSSVPTSSLTVSATPLPNLVTNFSVGGTSSNPTLTNHSERHNLWHQHTDHYSRQRHWLGNHRCDARSIPRRSTAEPSAERQQPHHDRWHDDDQCGGRHTYGRRHQF